MLIALRQRLVILLALAAAASYALARYGTSIGVSQGGLGPACERVFAVLAILFATLALVTVVGRLAAERRKLGAGFGRAQIAVTNAVVATLLGVLGFECVARQIDPLLPRRDGGADGLTGVNQPDPKLGWRGRPNFSKDLSYRVDDPEHPGKKRPISIPVRNNTQGLRDVEQKRDPTKPCVVVVGDSYAWGHCVTFEETAIAKLRPRLPQAQIYNLAVPAYSIDQIALSYELHGRPLAPKIVVALFLYVPVNMKSSPLGWGLQKPWFRHQNGNLELMTDVLAFGKDDAERLAFVRAAEASGVYDLGTAGRYLLRDWGGEVSWFFRRGIDAIDRMREKSTNGVPLPPAIVLAILRRLKRAVEADGAHFVLVTGPECTVVRWERLMREEHEKKEAFLGRKVPYVGPFTPVIQLFKKEGFDVVDLTAAFMPEGEALYDRDQHPGIVGNERMVEPMRERLLQLLPVR